VDPAVLDVVALACDASRRSGGIFDPTVLPLMHLYGFYGPERTSAPSAREVDAALSVMGSAGVRIDRGAGTLVLDRAGAGLDLGSIGKGWAVDRAVDALRARGVRSGLVDIGGKMYGLGSPDDDAPGWTAGLFHPVTNQLEHVFVLRDAAVGTSGNSERFRVIGHTRVGHLFDARRGVPSAGHLSASVVASTCLEADLLCTVAFLVGPDRFRDWSGARETRFIG
jgi:thiamine biosynthesis lipoprotein